MTDWSGKVWEIRSAQDLAAAQLRDLYDFWVRSHTSKSNITSADLVGIPGSAPLVALIEGEASEPSDEFEVKYTGSGIVRVIGHDPTGKKVGTINLHQRFQNLVRECIKLKAPIGEGPDRMSADYLSHLTMTQICLPSIDSSGVLKGVIYALALEPFQDEPSS